MNKEHIVSVQSSEAYSTAEASGTSDRVYRELFDGLPLMIFKLDGEGTVISANEHGARELGYSSEELLGRPVFAVIHPRNVSDLQEQLAHALRRIGEVQRWELCKVRKDGSELWVRETVRAIQAADGRPEVLVVCEDITDRRRANQRLAEARDQLRELNAEITRVAEREHRRISRVLHDEVGHTLAAARMLLCELQATELADGGVWRLEDLRQMIDSSIEVTRSLSAKLSPPLLYELGLVPALRALGEKIERDHGMAFSLEASDGWSSPSREVDVVLYQVARELLHNAVKHSQASCLKLVLLDQQGESHLTIADDGIGFDPVSTARSGSLGLFHARERLKYLDGRFEIEAAPGHGTCVQLTVPIPRAPLEAT